MDPNDMVEVERLAAAARDSLTDEMVTRLSATAAEGIDLLDRVNRSGVGKVLPALSQLVENGDLERLVALARTYAAMQDSLTDEMITRIAVTIGDSLSHMDRLNRAGADRLVGVLERMAATGTVERFNQLADQLGPALDLLERVMGALDAAHREIAAGPAAGGGFGGLWQLMRDRENQETLRFFLALGRHMRGARATR